MAEPVQTNVARETQISDVELLELAKAFVAEVQGEVIATTGAIPNARACFREASYVMSGVLRVYGKGNELVTSYGEGTGPAPGFATIPELLHGR